MEGKNMKKKLLGISICLIMMTTAFAGISGSVFAGEWPVFQYDIAHTGHSDSIAPVEGELLWMVENIGPTYKSPTVSDDGWVYTYIAIPEYGIKRYDALLGIEDEEFFVSIPGQVPDYGSVTINGDSLYYTGGLPGKVFCHQLGSGGATADDWEQQVGSKLYQTSPVVALGKVYVINPDGFIYCLNKDTGSLAWSYNTGSSSGNIGKSPVAVDATYTRAYVTGSDVYCVNANTGAWIWTYDPAGGTSGMSAPTLYGNKVFFAAGSRIYCVDAAGNGDGTTDLIWESDPLEGYIASSPAVANGYVYIGSSESIVYCLNMATGAIEWQTDMNKGNIKSSPAVVGGVVVIGSAGNLYGVVNYLDATTGAILWQYDAPEDKHIETSPAVVDGWTYISSVNSLYCYGDQRNTPPETPAAPEGPTEGQRNTKYHFTAQNVDDINGDDLYYLFDWGDGEDSGWIGPFNAGEEITIPAWHKWTEAGDYEIRVQAKDVNELGDQYSDWSPPHILHIGYLEISGVSGGFGQVNAVVTNAADYSQDIDWTVQVAGGIFGFHVVKREAGGLISLDPDESATVGTTGFPMIGLGPIKVLIELSSADETISRTIEGKIILFNVMV